VNAANHGGGQDNITVVAFEIADGVLANDGETREQALPPVEDEDTLDETDAVPVVETGVVPVDEIRAQDEAVRGRRRRGRLLAWLAILLLVAAVAVAVYVGFVR
jgi:hypothetical protein